MHERLMIYSYFTPNMAAEWVLDNYHNKIGSTFLLLTEYVKYISLGGNN